MADIVYDSGCGGWSCLGDSGWWWWMVRWVVVCWWCWWLGMVVGGVGSSG